MLVIFGIVFEILLCRLTAKFFQFMDFLDVGQGLKYVSLPYKVNRTGLWSEERSFMFSISKCIGRSFNKAISRTSGFWLR